MANHKTPAWSSCWPHRRPTRHGLRWRPIRLPLAWAVLAAVSARPAAADVPTPGDVVFHAPELPVKILNLPSGMRIVLEIDHAQPVVGVATVVDCGSAQDPAGKDGLAHLVEHLTFRARPNGVTQLSTLLGLAGAGTQNAFTEHDLTLYFELGPREALGALLRLEGARLEQPLAAIEDAVFEAERQVVRNEVLQRDENGMVTAALETLHAALYPVGHPYARSTAGSLATLWSLTLADAQDFARQCYQPRNYTLVVSGDFDPAEIDHLLGAALPAHLSGAPAGGAVPPARRLEASSARPPDPPPDTGIHWVKAPSDSPRLYIGWALPPGFGADAYAESFLARALVVTAEYKALEDDIVALDASLKQEKVGTTLILTVVLRTGLDPKRSAGHVLDVVRHLPNGGFSNTWMSRVRASAVVDLARTVDSLQARLIQRARLVHLTGNPLTYRRELPALLKVDTEQLKTLAWDWLNPGRARVVFLKPDDWSPPGREVGGSPHAFAPSDDTPIKLAPAALRTYVHGPAISMRSVVLESGLELTLVRRKGSTASVAVALRSGYATATPLGAADAAEAVATTRAPDLPADWGIRLATTTALDTTMVVGVAAGGNLENLLQLTSERLTRLKVAEPLPKAWGNYLSVLAELEAKDSARAQRVFFENIFAESSYPRLPTVADYWRLTVGDLNGWIERAYRPARAVAVVVSDLDAPESEAVARRWLGRWNGTSASPDAPFIEPTRDIGSLRTFRVERPGAKQTEVLMGCAVQPKTAPDAIALRLLATRLQHRMQSFARSRFVGAYSVSASTPIARRLGHVQLGLFVDDRNLSRVLAMASKELEELGSLRTSDEELGEMKWRLGISQTVAYSDGARALSVRLAEVRAADLPLDLVDHFPELLEAVNTQDIARMAAKCRATATLGLVGDATVMDKAFRAIGHGPADPLAP